MTPAHPDLICDEARMRAMRAAAGAALARVRPGEVLGVGTGSTVDLFIDLLAASDRRPSAAVASSLRTAHRLRAAGIDVVALPDSGHLSVYVDGADEVDPGFRLIKGGGGAHAREKVLACSADLFVCIVDDSKEVAVLGGRPVPVEVIPFARTWVARRLDAMGAHPVHRADFVTDNGNELLDARGLDLSDPGSIECSVECIPGVVACGVFGLRPADVLYVGGADGSVRETQRAPE